MEIIPVMIYNKNDKKGFTLMELLVTVILVAILASYAVYYYNNTMKEGEVHAAEGKLAALGGALARFKIEYGDITLATPELISPESISQTNCTCNYYSSNAVTKIKSMFCCGYVEKSLGFDNNFNFYFGSPNHRLCGGALNMTTVFMVPAAGYSSEVSCAYFDPDNDKVIEVK